MKTIIQAYGNLFKLHKIMLGILIIAILIIAIWQCVINLNDKNRNPLQEPPVKPIMVITKNNITKTNNKINDSDVDAVITNNKQISIEVITNEKDAADATDEHIVSSGDNLTSILTHYGLDIADITAFSNQHQALHNLRIGQTLSWELNKDGELQILTWIISRRETRVYIRQGRSNIFTEEKRIHQGIWTDKIIQGKINGNFTSSVVNAGLSYNEARKLYKIVEGQIDLRKLKAGDKFSVLLSRKIINGHSEQSRLLGMYLLTNDKNYYLFRDKNGHYYNSKANSFEQEFLRCPTAKNFKVSSHFSLHRINPVTGRPAPHQGVDFSMPIGTPILAVGDGEVIVAKYSRAAGNFIAIRHANQYITRYMHLRKLLVKPGQKVKKGDCIALSGNTGRTTGPHLHYELWFNQQAINPLTVNFSQSGILTNKNHKLFVASIKESKLKLTANQSSFVN